MAEDVSVQFGGQIEGLKAATKQAADSVVQMSERIKASVVGLQAPFEQLNKAILGVAAVAAGGLIFKSFVTEAVTAATETNKLAKTFGITVDEASQLRVQLKATGNTVDEYVSTAIRLDRQVRQNEETIRKTGMATRDASGALLNQQTLMVNAINTLRTYKEGTDRIIAAQVLFGRGAGEIEGLLRLTSASMQRAAKDAQELGLAVTPQDVANAKAYKLSMNELELSFQGIKKAIGEAVLPYLTAFANWFRSQAPGIISGMKETVKTVIEWAFDAAEGLAKFISDVTTLMVSFGILATYLGSVFGAIGDKTAESFVTALSRIDEGVQKIRDRVLSGLAQVRGVVMSGGPQAPVVPGEDGTRGAANLTKASKTAEQIAKIQLDAQIKVDKLKFQEDQEAINASFNQHRISEDQKYALLLQAKDKEFQLEIATLEKEQAALAGDAVKRAQVLARIRVAREQHELDIQRINNQSIAAQQAKYEQLAATIQGAWDSQLKGLLSKTTTWAQAWKNILGDLTLQFISFCEKSALNWAAAEIAKTTATTTGVTARTAAETAGASASIFTTVANALKSIFASAGVTVAGVTAQQAPIVGPLAVPEGIAAGATTLAAATALLPSLDIGGYVLDDGFAKIHKGETITPASVASPFDPTAAGGGSDTHLHFHGPYTGGAGEMDVRKFAKSLQSFLKLNPSLRPA